jgi:hypothetical protein
MKQPTIYVLSPDHATPKGGVKQLYRHVDILNSQGFRAFVVHQKDGFRAAWFPNRTQVTSVPELQAEGKPGASDVLVLPEVFWPAAIERTRGFRKVIFNQGAFHTLQGIPLDQEEIRESYVDDEIVGTLCVSDHNLDYLRYAFPGLQVSRIHYGFDPSLFYLAGRKKRQIAFMVGKSFKDVVQVVNLLKVRRTVSDFQLTIIKDMTESEVAKTLRDSEIFLSFGTQEGFSMPPTEAMACGCIVIGYDGWGGREYFKSEFSYPILTGDIITFASTIEKVADRFRRNPESMAEMGASAARYVSQHYSLERERQDIVDFWNKLIG